MHADCPVARSEGFAARTQVELYVGGRSAIATLYQVGDQLIAVDEVGLSESVWKLLGVPDGTEIKVKHPQPLESMSDVDDDLGGTDFDEDDDTVGGELGEDAIAADVNSDKLMAELERFLRDQE